MEDNLNAKKIYQKALDTYDINIGGLTDKFQRLSADFTSYLETATRIQLRDIFGNNDINAYSEQTIIANDYIESDWRPKSNVDDLILSKIKSLYHLIQTQNDGSEFAQFYIGALNNTILAIEQELINNKNISYVLPEKWDTVWTSCTGEIQDDI